MCQKAFGNAFAPLVTARGLSWTRGAPRHFRSSNRVRRGFCGDCGTPLTYEPDGLGIELSFCTLDEPKLVAPSIQVGLSDRLAWCQQSSTLPSRPSEEVADDDAFLAGIVSHQHPDRETPRPGASPLGKARDHRSNVPVSIRPIAGNDELDWTRLWSGYLKFYESEVPPDVYKTSFARLLDGGANEYRGLLAHAEGHAVGLVHFLFHRHMWRVENVCYLQDLFVAPDARGLGVGRALIEAVYAAADTEGAPSVYWMTQDFNRTARQLYDRVGQLTPFIKYAR
jgi:GNAT superfamily N-acetyltransferase